MRGAEKVYETLGGGGGGDLMFTGTIEGPASSGYPGRRMRPDGRPNEVIEETKPCSIYGSHVS
ncbi:MAG: hypothetical protein ACQESR_30840 [Planctomycetota bacterium]